MELSPQHYFYWATDVVTRGLHITSACKIKLPYLSLKGKYVRISV